MAALVDPRCMADSGVLIEGSTIEIIVGAERRAFFVHETLIRKRSEFFEAALSKEWKEATTRKVELPEDDSATFGRYVHWLYSGKIALKLANGHEDYRILANLCIIGEKLVDHSLHDRIIDAFVAAMRVTHEDEHGQYLMFPTLEVDDIYKHTTEASPLRRLLVDIYLIHGGGTWAGNRKLAGSHKDFLVDLTSALLEKRVVPKKLKEQYGELSAGVPCSYHKHGKDKPCPSKALWCLGKEG